MSTTRKGVMAAIGVTALAITGGAAIAATGLGSASEESDAIVAAAADDLGVTSTELEAALKSALAARVDAQLEAGTITDEQATELKARIASDDFPLVGLMGGPGRGGPGHHHGAGLDAAASYLGLTDTALRAALEGGDSLADVSAATDGKSVDGLVAAIVAAEKKQLAAAVASGRLTEAQQTEMLAGLEERVTKMVNGVRPAFGPRSRPGPAPEGDESTAPAASESA